MAQKRKRSASPPTSSTTATATVFPPIYRSKPLEDRSSTFQALFTPSTQSASIPKLLQTHPDINSASHKILAWRRESNQQSISNTGRKNYTTGHDDDGEKWGGKRVENVLESLNVTGSCVVARWWGGVMLGPARFTHMESVAREAIGEWRRAEEEERVRKKRMIEEEREREGLLGELRRRDESIDVLRKLAAEKEDAIEEVKREHDATATKEKQPKPRPATVAPVDYTVLTIDRLRALDKARDATLSFLLKRIDKAEAELSALRSKKEQKERKAQVREDDQDGGEEASKPQVKTDVDADDAAEG